MKTAILTSALSLFAMSAALAQTPPAYLDDRTDAAALVKSFYNAINRKEFARAWGYFGETKPSVDFTTFVKGYEATEGVTVLTGNPGIEGAAGSTIYSIPVAFTAFNIDKTEQVFAGCYTARLANPQIQEPPFVGLHLEGADLKRSEQPFEEKLPEKCGDGPAPEARDDVLNAAMSLFAAGHAQQCSSIRPDGQTDAPEAYAIPFRYSSSSEDEPESVARLFRFDCVAGAYNESQVYYLHDDVEGLRELQFATPELDIRYVNDDHEGKVESIAIIGYTTADELANSSYDEAAKSLGSFSKWRGIGDASSSGTWIFRDGTFTLVKYEVDASYDDQINPETVIDYNTGP